MFRLPLTSTRLLACVVSLAMAMVLVTARIGNGAKPKPGGNAGVETRMRDLEATVADLVERVERLESRRAKQGAENPVGVPSFRELVEGKATVLGDDGTFLGIISDDTIGAKSISNSVGRHGSTVGSESIFNDIGRYGSTISPTSARNDIASRPPKVYLNEKFVGFLTTNDLKSPRIDTDALIAYLKSQRSVAHASRPALRCLVCPGGKSITAAPAVGRIAIAVAVAGHETTV